MVNVGQVVRDHHGTDDVVIVGFAGHHGTVIAGDSWGAPMQVMDVPRARSGTHEDLLHQVAPHPALLVFPDDRSGPWLSARRGHRAIGVVYRPDHDPYGNWVPTVMGGRYDALVSLADTRALHPLHLEPRQPRGERDTFPWNT